MNSSTSSVRFFCAAEERDVNRRRGARDFDRVGDAAGSSFASTVIVWPSWRRASCVAVRNPDQFDFHAVCPGRKRREP